MIDSVNSITIELFQDNLSLLTKSKTLLGLKINGNRLCSCGVIICEKIKHIFLCFIVWITCGGYRWNPFQDLDKKISHQMVLLNDSPSFKSMRDAVISELQRLTGKQYKNYFCQTEEIHQKQLKVEKKCDEFVEKRNKNKKIRVVNSWKQLIAANKNDTIKASGFRTNKMTGLAFKTWLKTLIQKKQIQEIEKTGVIKSGNSLDRRVTVVNTVDQNKVEEFATIYLKLYQPYSRLFSFFLKSQNNIDIGRVVFWIKDDYIDIDTLDNFRRSNYSLIGLNLIETAFRVSWHFGFKGRMSLYTLSQSASFYWRIGFKYSEDKYKVITLTQFVAVSQGLLKGKKSVKYLTAKQIAVAQLAMSQRLGEKPSGLIDDKYIELNWYARYEETPWSSKEEDLKKALEDGVREKRSPSFHQLDGMMQLDPQESLESWKANFRQIPGYINPVRALP